MLAGNLADLFQERQQQTGLHFALYGSEEHPAAKRVIDAMGSTAVTCRETASFLSTRGNELATEGASRPTLGQLSVSRWFAPLSKTTDRICALDRNKEQGSQESRSCGDRSDAA